jgi:hypothetical protein
MEDVWPRLLSHEILVVLTLICALKMWIIEEVWLRLSSHDILVVLTLICALKVWIIEDVWPILASFEISSSVDTGPGWTAGTGRRHLPPCLGEVSTFRTKQGKLW